MEYLKIILGFLIISTSALTAVAQQSNHEIKEETTGQNDLWVGRTHYEDDLILDSFNGIIETENNDKISPLRDNKGHDGSILREYMLYNNYPNPFNPSTTIKFYLPEAGLARLTVYDINGKEISTLVNSQLNEGIYETRFDAGPLASGLYFYKLSVNSFSDVRKMILVK